MSLLLNICGVLVSVQQFPDAVLQEIYKQQYHCQIVQQRRSAAADLPVQAADQINRYFPDESRWWPLYTLDQVKSDSFKRMIQHGIQPGIIIPHEYVNWERYKTAKDAVRQGAIPVIEYRETDPQNFAADAVFSTALGLRPLAAYVSSGWDPNLLTQPKGSYIIQHAANDQLPLPAREIHYQQHIFYNATVNTQSAAGNQIIINPPDSIPLDSIDYPQFGISWRFHGIDFHSDEQRIRTNIFGYVLLPLSLINIPMNLILNTHYPNILSVAGSSISWVSLLLGIGLLLLLVISIIRRVRENGTD